MPCVKCNSKNVILEGNKEICLDCKNVNIVLSVTSQKFGQKTTLKKEEKRNG